MELYISYDQLEAHQEEGSSKIWDVFVNFLANQTLPVTHPSLFPDGALVGVNQPIFWNKLTDYNHEISKITIKYIKPTYSIDELNTVKELGSTVGSTSQVSGEVSEALASAGVISGFDSTGAVFKLSQMIKIIHRVKYIGCNFGKILDSFLSGQGKSFEISDEEKDSNMRLALESDYKLKNDEIPLLLFRKVKILNMVKESIYLVLWLTKAIGVTLIMKTLKKESSQYFMLADSKAKNFKRKCIFVYWVRKLEFVFFNMILADSLFILTHSLSVISLEGLKLELDYLDSSWDKILFLLRLAGSVLIFIAILVDMLELFTISLNISREVYYTIPKYELEKLKVSKESSTVKGVMGKEISSSQLKLNSNRDYSLFQSKDEDELKEIEFLTSDNKKKKAIDVPRTLQYLTDNPVLSIFALGELVLNPNFLDKNMLKLNGFFFIMKISIYQICVGSLPLSPDLCIFILFCTETFIFLTSLFQYLKHRHFKRRVLLAQKISQSLFFIVFFIVISMINYSKSSEPRSMVPVSPKLQYIAQYILIGALLFELLFTIIVITGTIYDLVRDKMLQKKKSKDQLEKEKLLKMNNGIIKYIFIELPELKQECQNKSKAAKLSMDQTINKNQVLPAAGFKKKKRRKRTKRDKKVTKFNKKKILKRKKFSQSKDLEKGLPEKQMNKNMERQPGGYLTACYLNIMNDNWQEKKKIVKNKKD